MSPGWRAVQGFRPCCLRNELRRRRFHFQRGPSSCIRQPFHADYESDHSRLCRRRSGDDKQGNVYIVGTHDSERSSDESYPLLVKYDSRGKIRLKTLARSLFANIDDPIGDGIGHPRSGGTRVAVSEKAILVYLAPAGEMVVLNQLEKSKSVSMWRASFPNLQRRRATRTFMWTGMSSRHPGICGLWVIWKSLQTVRRAYCLLVILSSD